MEQQAPSQAARELIGVSAYTNFTSFTRLAAAAQMTPDVSMKLVLARQAVAEFERYSDLERASERDGLAIQGLLAPFVTVIDEYHQRTEAADWVEATLKAYLGDGMLADLHRMLAERIGALDPDIAALILTTLPDEHEEQELLEALRADLRTAPDRAGRLALYARKLLGETMTRARAALRRAKALADVTRADPGPLGEPNVVLARLAQAHDHRMSLLGLDT